MSWADVEAAINFWGPGGPANVNGIAVINGYPVAAQVGQPGFAPQTQQAILDALQDLYNHSPTAQALLEQGARNGSLWFFNVTGRSGGSYSSSLGPGTVGIDLNQPPSFQWMGRNGQMQQEKLAGTVIHELIHAIRGTADLVNPDGSAVGAPGSADFNNPRFDFLGQTVFIQDQIFQEMGWGYGYYQVGYAATNSEAPYLNPNISYTEGNTIDIAYFGDTTLAKNPTNIDFSARTDNDLIIGGSHNVTIQNPTGPRRRQAPQQTAANQKVRNSSTRPVSRSTAAKWRSKARRSISRLVWS